MSIKKVFTATINADHPQRGMIHAFDSLFYTHHFDYLQMERNGATASDINAHFIAEVLQFQPDWCWLQLQNTGLIQRDAILEIKRALPHCVVSHWMGDCRYTVSDYLASICFATDISFIAAAGQEDMFRAAGAKFVKYLQIAIDWHEEYLEDERFKPPFQVPEVLLIGNHYGPAFPGTPQRESALRALRDAGLNYGVVGSGWPGDINTVGSCHVKDQIAIWKRAKVGISISNFNEIPLYYSDRQIISMASGTPIVCYRVPDLETEFTSGRHCLFFKTNEELVGQVKFLLDNPDIAELIGREGRAIILREHTWFRRVLDILPLIEQTQKTLQQV